MKLSLVAAAAFVVTALTGCTHDNYPGSWELKAGTVISTTFQIDVTQVDEGAEDSTTYNDHYPACVVTSDHEDIVAVSRAQGELEGSGQDHWLVWGKRAGSATISLDDCAADNHATINVVVTGP